MKAIFILLGSGLLATTLVAAQDAPTASESTSAQTQTKTYQTSSSVIRGCLSGSDGNYTITDQNGMQYQINGPDNQLAASVGHEIEVSTHQDTSSEASSQGDQPTARSSNTVQVSGIRDISKTCHTASSTSPMNNNDSSPKGAPDAAAPPQPQFIGWIQQQSAPDTGTKQEQQNGTAPPQATPPVTSQTPATPTGAANGSATTQQNTSPANNAGMTESEANHDAQAARQGELNTNPNTGDTSGRGVNNQGVNNPTSTSPNAVPTSPNSATPQSNADDANKPLYERQATDIPWANQQGGNTGTPNPPH